MDIETTVQLDIIDNTGKGYAIPTGWNWDEDVNYAHEVLNSIKDKRKRYASMEPDTFKLDGSTYLLPDEPGIAETGVWSTEATGEDGRFALPPKLELDFYDVPHETCGFTFDFNKVEERYCNDLLIQLYNGNTLIEERQFTPDSTRALCSLPSFQYTKVIITFYGMNKAYQRLKLDEVSFGLLKTFTNKELIAAKIIEEVSIPSTELSVNTFSVELLDLDNIFDILKPDGVYHFLRQLQKVTVKTVVDGKAYPMGTFYLDDWESTADQKIKLSCIDVIGVASNRRHEGIMVTADETLWDTLDRVLTHIVGPTWSGMKYTVTDDLADTPMLGYIPRTTTREALQYCAFATGALVDCSRNDAINVFRAAPDVQHTIDQNRIIQGSSIKLKNAVSKIELTTHSFSNSGVQSTIYNGALVKGENVLYTDKPIYSVNNAPAEYVDAFLFYCNYLYVDAKVDCQLAFTGTYFDDSKTIITYVDESIALSAQNNTVKSDVCTMVNPGNAKAVLDRLVDYYDMRLEHDFDFILQDEKVGDRISIYTNKGYAEGYLERMEIDLMTFIAKARAVTGITGQ